jgi:DNA primase
VSRSEEMNSGRRDLVDVERLRVKCPVCGARRRCSVREDGALVICYHAGSERESRDGGWVHRLDDGQRASLPRIDALPPECALATDDVLDRAYRALLSRCGLSSAHRAALLQRGLSAEHIATAGYATLEREGRAALGRAIVEAVGQDAARGVPGYVVRGEGFERWPSIAGSPGLLVPCRDLTGRVLGVQVRRDNPSPEQGRYAWLSSRAQGGAGRPVFAHVPAFVRDDERELIVTEGPIKADVVTALTGRFCIAIPGVSAWERAVSVASQVRPSLVWLALDADLSINRHVAQALDRLREGMRAAGLRYRVLRWPLAEGKGIDDLIARHGARAFGRAVAWTERLEAQ